VSRIAYVNGRYVPHRDASVHVEDRGYQFADGVYEVCEIHGGKLVDEKRHLDRLGRSLGELRIDWPLSREALRVVLREVVRRNRVRDGLVYFQVTRGVARRDHAFPKEPVRPSLVVTARSSDPHANDALAEKGIAVVTCPDNRWERVDIKTVGLLPNVLARQVAVEAGAKEAWFVDAGGHVTEGASTNAWIVAGDKVITRPADDNAILRGVTRTTIIDMLAARGLTLEERAFTVAEAQKAREAFMTAATSVVMPIVRIDGVAVGEGRPGPVALGLRRALHSTAELA